MARKTGREAKVERATWFALMISFLGLSNAGVRGAWMCLAICAILAISGIYQYSRRWRVGPIVWVCAGISGLVGGYGLYFQMTIDLSLVALGIVVVVILFGVVTNES